jgi:hypothetical protein
MRGDNAFAANTCNGNVATVTRYNDVPPLLAALPVSMQQSLKQHIVHSVLEALEIALAGQCETS